MNEIGTSQGIIDKLVIADLIQFERLYRDQQQWERLQAMYHPDSRIRLGWFVGTGEEYVVASRHLESRKSGWHLTHLTAPTQVQVYEDRAIAETNTLIIRRSPMNGVLADATIYCRLYSRVERRCGVWRILTLDVLYEKDTIIPVYASDHLELDREDVDRGPAAYRFTAYNLAKIGYSSLPDELYATDQPERVAQLLREGEDWLYQR